MEIISRYKDWIIDLEENEIFVFGSNEGGFHGKGAARLALKWGAKWGQGEGLQGRTYGIPTKNYNISKTLTISQIEVYVKRFIEFAKLHSEYQFLVTEIGCGLAGYRPKQIAPLFKDCKDIQNISFTTKFWHILNNLK